MFYRTQRCTICSQPLNCLVPLSVLAPHLQVSRIDAQELCAPQVDIRCISAPTKKKKKKKKTREKNENVIFTRNFHVEIRLMALPDKCSNKTSYSRQDESRRK